MALKTHIAGLEEKPLVKLFVAGHQGAGKTLMASTFPNAYFASCESRVLSLQERRTPYAKIESQSDMDELIRILRQPPSVRENQLGRTVDTIVVDTWDGFQKTLKMERTKKNGGTFLRDDWGWIGDTMRSFVKAIVSLDMNVVVTCHLADSTDSETGRVTYFPALEGSIKNDIANHFDIVGILTARPKTAVTSAGTERVIERVLQLFPDTQFQWLKDCTGRLPLEFPVNLNDDYDRMRSIIFANWDERAAQAEKELKDEEAAAAVRTEEIVQALAESVEKEPDPIDLVQAPAADTVNSDQFKQLTSPFAEIQDEDVRRQVKAEFVTAFGNPTVLPTGKFAEALAWVTEHVEAAVFFPADEEATEATEEVPEAVSSPEAEEPATVPEEESTAPTCSECGETVDDQDLIDLAELQGLPTLCRTHLRQNK